MVSLGVGIDMFLKDAEAYSKNPNTGNFVEMRASAGVLAKHLHAEKFVKGLK
jgi:hypothetical protein